MIASKQPISSAPDDNVVADVIRAAARGEAIAALQAFEKGVAQNERSDSRDIAGDEIVAGAEIVDLLAELNRRLDQGPLTARSGR